MVDRCQFLSNEQPLNAQDRTSIALNVNSNDPKLRNNRIVRFAHFAVLGGSGNIITGNHFFQGDDQTATTSTTALSNGAMNMTASPSSRANIPLAA